MALQVRRVGTADYGEWIKVLVCGHPGSGKSRSASTWPGLLYASAEGGMMSVADRQPAVVEINSSTDLLELKNALQQPPQVQEKMIGFHVQTLCIDTIDQIARILIEERISEQKKETMAIQDWGWLGDQLRNIVRAFRNLPMNLVMNCHLRSSEDSETGRTFIKPSIQGAMGDEIAGYVDLALLMHARPMTQIVDGQNVRTIVRILQSYPDAQHAWIKDRSGKLPMEFGVNFEDDYARMHELIYGSRAGVAEVQTGTQVKKVEVAGPAGPPVQTTVAEPAIPAAQPAAENPPTSEPEPVPSVPSPAETRLETPPTSVELLSEEATPEGKISSSPANTPVPANIEESVPATETIPPDDFWNTCEQCGDTIETKDQADLSYIRFRKRMCRKCFAATKKR